MESLTTQQKTTLTQFMIDTQIMDSELCINILQVTDWDVNAARFFIRGDPGIRPGQQTTIFESHESSDDEDENFVQQNSGLVSFLWENWIVRSFLSIYNIIFDFLKSFFTTENVLPIAEEEKFLLFDHAALNYANARSFCSTQHGLTLLYIYRLDAQCRCFHKDILLDFEIINVINSYPMTVWPVFNSDELPLDLQSRINFNAFPAVYVLNIMVSRTVVYPIHNLKNIGYFVRNLQQIFHKVNLDKQTESFLVETRALRIQQQREYEEALQIDEQNLAEVEPEEVVAVQISTEDWEYIKTTYRLELPPETVESGPHVLKFRIRYSTGRTVDRRFLRTDSCRDIYRFAYLGVDAPYRMRICSVYPFRRVPCELDDGPEYADVGDLGLLDRSVLVVYDKDA